MSVVAGIDFSSSAVDVVLLEEESDEATWQHYDLLIGDAFDRARRVRDMLPGRGWWADAGVIAIALERPAGASRRAQSALMRCQGAILSCLPSDMLVTEYGPSEWKALSVGFGAADKQEVAAFAWAHAGEDWTPSQDASDAYCMAWALRSQFRYLEAM